MPYLKKEDKKEIDKALKPILAYLNLDGKTSSVPTQVDPGLINYIITKVLIEAVGIHPNYGAYNELLGAVEAAKLEFYRRAVAPYEDKKIKENGDVYEKKET